MLRQLPHAPLKRNPKTEPWFSLWSALCHQSDVYTASYAATPYILHEAAQRPPSERLEHLHLSGYIEICRHRPHSPPLPEQLAADYESGLSLGARLAIESLGHDWDEISLRALLAVLAAFRGMPRLGAGIIEGRDQDYCPKCDALITLPGYDLFDSQT